MSLNPLCINAFRRFSSLKKGGFNRKIALYSTNITTIPSIALRQIQKNTQRQIYPHSTSYIITPVMLYMIMTTLTDLFKEIFQQMPIFSITIPIKRAITETQAVQKNIRQRRLRKNISVMMYIFTVMMF